MTQRRLFVHVGTHKTGTTSFQRALVDHRPALVRSGLTVIVESTPGGRTTANCSGFANAMLRRSLRTGARMRGKQPEPTWRQVLAHIGAVRTAFDVSTTPDLVLSAEALCFAREPAERRRVAAALRAWGSPEVIPVVAVRDEDGWRASWEAQLDAWAPEIDGERGTGTDDVLGDWYFDAEAVVAFWSHFGDVRCVDYGDAVTEHGSVVPALVTALERRSGLLTKDYRLNPRRAGD